MREAMNTLKSSTWKAAQKVRFAKYVVESAQNLRTSGYNFRWHFEEVRKEVATITGDKRRAQAYMEAAQSAFLIVLDSMLRSECPGKRAMYDMIPSFCKPG